MRQAAGAGARLVQFPEGALVYPDKRVGATDSDGAPTPGDWTGPAWDVLSVETLAVL
ncbi:hypothetical protein AB0F92_40430 [Kitasatospora aureofaciens]|uniref:hypothetical protein n=1 Tax=Kitasatospora aureofaciens TaxID=1894 RepID=UPI0033F22C79